MSIHRHFKKEKLLHYSVTCVFSVYINDLPSYVSSSTGVGLFADDTKLCRCIKNPSDALVLQEDIIISITRKTSPSVSPYSLAGDLLSFSDAEVNLGITISPKLTWIHQVSKVKSKANKLLGLIRRSTLEMTDIKARKYLYLQLVRSNFAYIRIPSMVSTSVQLIENIEKVQRRATKFILNLGFVTNIPYSTRLHNLDLLPITYWHECLDIILLYKIINNYTYH